MRLQRQLCQVEVSSLLAHASSRVGVISWITREAGLEDIARGCLSSNECGEKVVVKVKRQGRRNGRSLLSAEPVRRGEEGMGFMVGVWN